MRKVLVWRRWIQARQEADIEPAGRRDQLRQNSSWQCLPEWGGFVSRPEDVARLERCFAAVFPGLTPEQLRQADADNLAAWDSMNTVTLMAVVNEEFGSDLDLDQMEPLRSFQSLLGYLERKS
jgi:acyl carrier protein